jgi:hypothetical protein
MSELSISVNNCRQCTRYNLETCRRCCIESVRVNNIRSVLKYCRLAADKSSHVALTTRARAIKRWGKYEMLSGDANSVIIARGSNLVTEKHYIYTATEKRLSRH